MKGFIKTRVLLLIIGTLVGASLQEPRTPPSSHNIRTGNPELDSKLSKTDEETAKMLVELQTNKPLLLCIGIFSRIPKEYFMKKVEPMQKLVDNNDLFGKYVDRYVFNALNTCLKKTKAWKQEEVCVCLDFWLTFSV